MRMSKKTSCRVVQASLRLQEEQETRRKALEMALIEGEQSGAPSPFDFDALLEAKRTSAHRGR
jgi:antitoxin ParD1/3/4